MVKKAVHDINYTLDNVDWINVQSIIFIATPHRGLEDDTLQTMVKGQPSEQLITELHENSPTLRQLRDCFKRVAEDIKILTLFEKQPTNTIELVKYSANFLKVLGLTATYRHRIRLGRRLALSG